MHSLNKRCAVLFLTEKLWYNSEKCVSDSGKDDSGRMRRIDREVTDLTEILKIIDAAKILHLGMMEQEYPYVVPMHFGYEYAGNQLIFYLHCAKEGHKLDVMQENPHVCVELETNVELVSGGDVPCKYGASFASVFGRGKAELVENEREKIKGLKLLMQNQTQRAFEINEEMAATVAVIKVTVDKLTAKRRLA